VYSEQVEETCNPELIYILRIVLESIFYEFGYDGAEKRAR